MLSRWKTGRSGEDRQLYSMKSICSTCMVEEDAGMNVVRPPLEWPLEWNS